MKRPSMDYWLGSDFHFGHDRAIREGWRKEGYEEDVWAGLRQIGRKDIFICLGDVAFYDVRYWHDFILTISKASKNFLILGNHDRDTMSKYYSFGWSMVARELKLKLYGKVIVFSHEPVDPARTDYDFNIHGHYHDDDHRCNGKLPENARLIYTKIVTLKSVIGA